MLDCLREWHNKLQSVFGKAAVNTLPGLQEKRRNTVSFLPWLQQASTRAEVPMEGYVVPQGQSRTHATRSTTSSLEACAGMRVSPLKTPPQLAVTEVVLHSIPSLAACSLSLLAHQKGLTSISCQEKMSLPLTSHTQGTPLFFLAWLKGRDLASEK